jgi:hypothetical protein
MAAAVVCVNSDGTAASATGSVMVDLRKFRRDVGKLFSFINC